MAKRPAYVGASSPSLHERLLMETLGRLAAPEVVERILRLALHDADLGAVPDDSAAFGSFACGPLRAIVADALGEDCADATIADLEPAFMRASDKPDSAVRRRARRSMEAPGENAPAVLVATPLRATADRIGERLREHVKLVFADDVFGLLKAAQRLGDTPCVLAVHDELPGLRDTTLATLARLLPRTATVVQFGRLVIPHPSLEGDAPLWYPLGPVTDPDAIADVCLAVLPDPAPRPRVLLAHPDPAYRAATGDALRDAGYDVSEATDGLTVLDLCEREPHQAVLAPAWPPGLGGLQLAAILEGRPGAGPRFVLLSADAPLDAAQGVTTVVSEDGAIVEVMLALIPVRG